MGTVQRDRGGNLLRKRVRKDKKPVPYKSEKLAFILTHTLSLFTRFSRLLVNTRQLKRSKQKHSSYINASALNTIVEENGTLRNGTLQELTTVAWKLPRHTQEHLYAGAKRGWLDRAHNRKAKGGAATAPWGKAASPAVVVATATTPVAATAATTTTPDGNAAAITSMEAESDEAPDDAQATTENDKE
jgi:hypothetical protein